MSTLYNNQRDLSMQNRSAGLGQHSSWICPRCNKSRYSTDGRRKWIGKLLQCRECVEAAK